MVPKSLQHPSYVMKCRIGLDGYWQEVPRRFCEMLGYTEEELLELTFADVIHPDDRSRGIDLAQKMRDRDLREFEIEKKYQTKSGDPVWVYVSGALIKNDEGNPQYVVCYIHDISDRKRSQQKLKESEQRFRSLFKHNPHPVYYFDLEGNFQGVNEKLIEFTGYSRAELLKMGFESFIVEEDLERTKKHFRKAAEGTAGEYEIQVVVKNGENRDVRVTKFPMYVGDEVTGVFGILQDITEQKKAKRRLKESEERWQRLVQNNPQPIQVTQDAKIIFINEAGARLYGAESTEELIGRTVYEFSDPKSIDQIKQRKKRLEEGKEVEEVFEHKINRLDGEERYVEIYSIPTVYRGKATIQSVFYDVTDKKVKERKILKSLDEKKMLLREIHHRVKNNLAVISGLLELQTMNTDDESTVNTLRDSQHRIQSIAMVHEKLYQSEALLDIGFDTYLKELVDSIAQTYKTASMDVELSYDLAPVNMNLNQAIPCSLIINEVIVNCYKHAFNGADSGYIEITSRFDEPELIIKVEDNGSGLPDDFDITSQQSLGMTLIQTLAQQLEGEISFSSDGQSSGTRFELRFEKEEKV